jgi:hypothetical protein
LKTYQPERALIARQTRKENNDELAKMLAQIAMERAARLPPSLLPVSLETQFQIIIHRTREDIQRAKDVQSAHILRWLQS